MVRWNIMSKYTLSPTSINFYTLCFDKVIDDSHFKGISMDTCF